MDQKEQEKEKIEQALKQLLFLRFCLYGFVGYTILLFAMFIGLLFYDSILLNRLFDLAIYLGSVAGIGFSIYIIQSWFRMKNLFMVFVGVVMFLVNSYNIADHIIKYFF